MKIILFNYNKCTAVVCCFLVATLCRDSFATPWAAGCQPSLSGLDFPGKNNGEGCQLPLSRGSFDPVKPMSPCLAGGFFPLSHWQAYSNYIFFPKEEDDYLKMDLLSSTSLFKIGYVCPQELNHKQVFTDMKENLKIQS